MNAGWEQALEVQAQLLKQINGPFWGDMSQAWLNNRLRVYGRNAMLPSAHAMRVAGEIVAESEPIFITKDMLNLTRTAMESFDWHEQVRPEDFFLRQGFALLEAPFYAPDVQGLETAWRAVSWRFVELPAAASPPEINEPVPSLEILLWWDTHDEDGWDLQHPDQIKFARQQYKAWGMRWAVMHCTLCPLEYMSDLRHMGNDGDPAATWMTFIRVFNKLMAERIVLKSRLRPHRAVRRAAQRLGMTEIRDVVVCELRRAKPRGYEWPESGEGGHLTHRFMVSGHWRQQWYPSEGRHKQKWIAPYIKGPDDGEFIEKKRVWIWDR